MRPIIIAILGHKDSGKTKIIEFLTQELTMRGLKVVTIKHIAHDYFEVNAEGKDTWRHKKAGAKIVIGISEKRMAIIDDIIKSSEEAFNYALEYLMSKNPDVILIEGFSKIVSSHPDIRKVVIARDLREVQYYLNIIKERLIGVIKRGNFELKTPGIKVLTEKDLLHFVLDLLED